MTAYLITFKPQTENSERGWPVEKLAALANRVRKLGSARESWRFNRRKDVKVGERVFLLRQGRQGHAILGYGRVAELPKDNANRMTVVEFEALINPLLRAVYATADELHQITDQDKLWKAQASGNALPANVATRLEALVVGRAPIQAMGQTDSADPELVTDRDYAAELDAEVAKASRDNPAARRARLKKANKKPRKVLVQSTNYLRNADVIAEVLVRASGHCEGCNAPAPFARKSDKTPYLEVHHVIQLADGGDDTVKNAVALCPNCHRKRHFG
jgi:5-methylcytosine-specific restriction endonuclease McrA